MRRGPQRDERAGVGNHAARRSLPTRIDLTRMPREIDGVEREHPEVMTYKQRDIRIPAELNRLIEEEISNDPLA